MTIFCEDSRKSLHCIQMIVKTCFIISWLCTGMVCYEEFDILQFQIYVTLFRDISKTFNFFIKPENLTKSKPNSLELIVLHEAKSLLHIFQFRFSRC